eukprot:CAMPEP_0114554322 /NCGR_PEP_ID=MMETSP0114-20121206/8151_1 /TAXON_ID=31324 /ORGANISM="Goniomonas sp, Strain m" /LENGTH=85 /DNA_ID=CAMNT_0001739367 /DNA_START=206 /DNA_END=464 /DNA_ORIENTATION=-
MTAVTPTVVDTRGHHIEADNPEEGSPAAADTPAEADSPGGGSLAAEDSPVADSPGEFGVEAERNPGAAESSLDPLGFQQLWRPAQ